MGCRYFCALSTDGSLYHLGNCGDRVFIVTTIGGSMANPEHVKMLNTYTREQWNAWLAANPYEWPDVSRAPIGITRKSEGHRTVEGLADFRGFDFRRVDLTNAWFHESDLTCADLRKRIYTNVTFARTKMHNVKLNGSTMRNCVFTWSDLTSADLTGAKFPESHLEGVILSNAKLHNTDFATTDLTSAIFSNCDLSSAKLTEANLACTSLHQSGKVANIDLEWLAQNMVDQGFAESVEQVFERVQYFREKNRRGQQLTATENDFARHVSRINVPGCKKLGSIESLSDLFLVIGDKIEMYEDVFGSKRFRMYYRGHACSRWTMVSSLDHGALRDAEPELLSELTRIEPDEFRGAESALDRLVLARHHSLPARLLDITRNPFVALYFASQKQSSCDKPDGHETCDRDGQIHMLVTPAEMVKNHDSDTVSVISAMSQLRPAEQDVLTTECPYSERDLGIRQGHLPDVHMRPGYEDVMQRLVHFIARDKPYFRNAIDPRDFFRVLVVEPRRAFARVRAQSGAFLLSGFHKEFEADKIAAKGPEIPIYDHYTIDVPRDAKPGIMKQLGYAQITDETMLPGLEPVATYIAERYGTRKED